MPSITYAKAGVDIRKEELAVKSMVSWLRKTFKFRQGMHGQVLGDIGGYANLIDIGNFALAMTIDGVGSKVLVAQELDTYDTIGIDLVAMNVNDLLCVGAEPLALVDYIAFQHVNEKIAKEISIGLYEGAKQAKIAIVGGETATLPEMIKGIGSKGFDLAGAGIGIVEKDKVITGKDIKIGDVVLGLPSNGIHSNGLTLARKVLPRSMWLELLKPTRIYVEEVLNIISNYRVNGLAHITGGGLLNLTRLTSYGFFLDSLPQPQLIFRRIQEESNISMKEMYRTFNMGVGFIIVMPPEEAEKALDAFESKYKLMVLGKVVKESEVRLKLEEESFRL